MPYVYGAGPLDTRQITLVIKECKEAGVLALILHEQRGVLNHSQVSAAWVCLARIGTRGRGGGEVREVIAALQDRTRGVQVRIHPENARMSGRHGVQYVAQCAACAALTLVVWQ